MQKVVLFPFVLSWGIEIPLNKCSNQLWSRRNPHVPMHAPRPRRARVPGESGRETDRPIHDLMIHLARRRRGGAYSSRVVTQLGTSLSIGQYFSRRGEHTGGGIEPISGRKRTPQASTPAGSLLHSFVIPR